MSDTGPSCPSCCFCCGGGGGGGGDGERVTVRLPTLGLFLCYVRFVVLLLCLVDHVSYLDQKYDRRIG